MVSLNMLDHLAELLAQIVRVKRLRKFHSSPKEEDGEVQQILALLKSCPPAEVCAEAMEGGHLFVGRAKL